MIDPATIVFAINGLIKLGRAADLAAAQAVRDKPVQLPLVDLFAGNEPEDILELVNRRPELLDRLASDAAISETWTRFQSTVQPDDSAAILRYLSPWTGELNGIGTAGALTAAETSALVEVGQWRKGTGPRPAWVGFALSVVDVGLSYVALDPSIIGLHGSRAQFIGAVAANAVVLIQDTDPWDKRTFAEQIGQTLIHSGLQALATAPETLLPDQDWRTLVQSTAKPIVDAWPSGNAAAEHDYRKLVDALLGPAFKAAVTAIAEKPDAFLGNRLDPNRPGRAGFPGILIKSLLDASKEQTAPQVVSEAGLLKLFRAGLTTVAAHPELVIDSDSDARTAAFARQLFTEFLTRTATLIEPQKLFTPDFKISLAVAAIESVEVSSVRLFDKDNPWQAMAQNMFAKVLDGLGTGLSSGPDGLQAVFAPAFVSDLARVFLLQAAKTPQMLTGKHDELNGVVAAVASAIAADSDLLLTRDDWLRVAAVTAEEAASNPARLFGLETNTGGLIGTAVIGDVLKAAAARFRLGTAGGALLFGPTLTELMVITLRATAANFDKIRDNREVIAQLIGEITRLVDSQPQRLGSKEFLALYRALIGGVLATGKVSAIDVDRILSQ